jgi:PAS domain S-box-containing protein
MKPLKALIVEDSNDDAALLLRHLFNEGFEVQSAVVQTAADMKAALATRPWDIILSDYVMPSFSGLDALSILKESGLDIPIIIISGIIGEDTAVEAMLIGVNDYLLKDNLTRLAPAIEREIENAARRRAQQQAEETLRQSEASLANAQRIAHIGNFDWDIQNKQVFWSDEVYRILNLPKGSIESSPELIYKYIHPDDKIIANSVKAAALSKAAPYEMEIRVVRPGGEERIVHLIGELKFDKSGTPLRLTATIQDITERKAAENEMRLMKSAIDSIVEGITISDAQNLNNPIIYTNAAFENLTGYTFEEIQGKNCRFLQGAETNQRTVDEIREALEKETTFRGEILNYHKNGGSFWNELIISPVFDQSGRLTNFVGVQQDISKRKRIETEKAQLTVQIELQHERLNNIVANVPGVVWEAWGEPDAATQRIDFVSDYVETMLGYTVEEWITTPNFWLSIVHPEDKERIAREAAEKFHTGEGYTRQFRWIAKDGRIVWVESQATVIRDESGQPTGLRGINIDITERKRLEEERTELIAELDFEKARLQHIFDNSPSFIVSLRGPEFVFEMANPAYYRLVGHRNLIGIPASEVLPEVMTQGLSEIISQVYNTGEPFIGNEVPVKLQPQDSSELEQHYLNFVYMPLRKADNSVSGIISYGVDVTEQVLSRIKIQESEERYRFLFENNPLPMWVFDVDTLAFLSVNDAAIQHYGYSEKEFLTMNLKDIRPPEEVATLLQHTNKSFPGIDKAGDFKHLKKNGTFIDVEIVSKQLIFNGKNAELVLANDITERKLADRKIRESEERYRIVAETANDVIITIDEHSSILFVNSAMEKTLGYKPEELIGNNLSIIVPERLRAAHSFGMNRYMQTGRKSIPWSGLEIQALHRDGSEKQIEISFSEYHENNKRFFTSVIRDITERKQAQQIILESEEKYRSIVETANEGIWLADVESVTTYVNRQMAEMLGYTVDEMVGRPIFDFIFEDDFSAAKHKVTQRIEGISETNEFRLRKKDGSEIITQYNANPIRNQAGEIVGFLSMNTDITERKNAATALREAEDKYRNLVESSPAIVYLAEPHPPFSPIYVSPNVTRFGYTAEEWFDRPDMWVSLIHDEDRARVLRATENAVAQGEETDMEYRVVAKDGAIVWLHDKGRFVLDEQGNKTGWQGMMVDITKNKELEDQLRQSQKLESVGLLAGGIAHDFNNMLTAINGYSELTMRKMGENDPLRRNILEIKKAGQRSADLTHQLLAFSRQQILQPIVLDLNETIVDTIKMLSRLIGEDIQLTTTLNPNTGLVKVDQGQISQIIMNLAVNARDAMPQGGKLTIETANIFLDPDYARKHVGVLPGAYVMLAVSDTGSGMSRQTKEHIFEPFFTTKEIGQGTGLGLATVYGIVKQSGGSIEVYSEESVGTTFKLYLPRVANRAVELENKDISFDLPKGTETILLVEDEEMVRNLSRTILEECGYTVFEAHNGLEALKICEQRDYKFDLLMTDVVMPEMGGRELADLLKEKLPDLQVLFTSGYTDDAVVRHGVIELGTNFIQKPFTPDLLAKKIWELLDSSEKGIH